ncbi:J domain-containing protein [Planctellipticum variicoloris]|uniref:J domain-containing protein n=1 Tax=Planctellipticum variicoloris TaxID=3064265 RepID=UPI003013F986|nr:J domain-containing protein [Planctomycetaceae bacterium SH412]
MTEHHLPDDISDWPTNPYELLGIPCDADRDVIRRAYVKLILRYKPERFPAEFQRIRKAYERVRQQTPRRLASWDLPFPSIEALFPQEPESSRNADPFVQQPSDRIDRQPEAIGQPDPLLSQRIAAAWQLAVDGQPSEAYQQFVELGRHSPEHEGIAIRRYWLVRLAPQVAPDATPLEMLLPHVRAMGLSGLFGQLFLAELVRQPEAAFGESCLEVLRDARSTLWRRSIFRIRWHAAAIDDRWIIIDQDLDELRQLSPLDSTPWLWGHLDALAVCLKIRTDAARERALAYLEVLHKHNDWSHEAIQVAVEEIDWMLQESRTLPDWCPSQSGRQTANAFQWADLTGIVTADEMDSAGLRLKLEPLLADWVRNPAGGLRDLDSLYQSFPAHAVRLNQFVGELLFEGSTVRSTLSGGNLRQAVLEDLFHERRLRRPTFQLNAADFRSGVLLFCVEERVDLEPVALTLHELMPNLPWDCEFHPLRLEGDDALRTVIRGCLALWDEPAVGMP